MLEWNWDVSQGPRVQPHRYEGQRYAVDIEGELNQRDNDVCETRLVRSRCIASSEKLTPDLRLPHCPLSKADRSMPAAHFPGV